MTSIKVGRGCGSSRKTNGRLLPDNVFPKNELRKGIIVEHEHTDDNAEAKAIAKDHLVESDKYYTLLAGMEKKFK